MQSTWTVLSRAVRTAWGFLRTGQLRMDPETWVAPSIPGWNWTAVCGCHGNYRVLCTKDCEFAEFLS